VSRLIARSFTLHIYFEITDNEMSAPPSEHDASWSAEELEQHYKSLVQSYNAKVKENIDQCRTIERLELKIEEREEETATLITDLTNRTIS
jgi:hypothetical protein